MAKAGLDLREIAKRALNLACLSHSFDFFVFILVDFIVRAPNVRPLCDVCVLKELRSDSINAAKFYRALRSLNLKFSLQNLICARVLTRIALEISHRILSRPIKF